MGGSTVAIITVQLADSITAADALLLCERLQVQLARSDVAAVACDTGRLTDPDVTMVDVLARLQLTARRGGCSMSVRRASSGLQELLLLVGLVDVVPIETPSPFEPGREAEQSEQARIDEMGQPIDPPG
ncbi:MAG: STAS domain-containing protein [Jiangellaceae bacterium]|jgi:ABC-type transporter Mla MlaB component